MSRDRRAKPGRERKKKPGEMAEARRRHLHAQRAQRSLSDLKAGMPTGALAFGPDRQLAIFWVRPFKMGEPARGQLVLCVFSRRLHVMEVIDPGYSGGVMVTDSETSGRLPPRQVHGVATRVNGNLENWIDVASVMES